MSSSTSGEGSSLPAWARAGAVLAATIALAGVAAYALTRAGHPDLATLAWVAGYGGAVVVVWTVWLRELEFEPAG